MKQYIACITILFSHKIFACIPLTQNDVFIARYNSIESHFTKSENYKVKLMYQKFIFRNIYQNFKMQLPEELHSDFQPTRLHPNDMVIGLAYAPDSAQPKSYKLVSISKLSCNDDQLSIGKPSGNFLAWDRQKGQCKDSNVHHIGILDGFINHDQSYYLKQLQTQYPACKALEATFPKLNSVQNDLSIFQKIYRWLMQ